MTKPTKVPGIPKPPSDVSPGLRGWLTSVAEALEIRLGRRGDPKDRAVTLRELIESGLAEDIKSAPFDPNNFNGGNTGIGPVTEVDSSVPPTPTSFSVAPAYSQVNLSWDYPNYGNHSFTEIYGHSANVIGDAQLIGVSTGRVYIDPIGGGASRYYWIRHVSTSSVQGPFNSGTGTAATTATDVAHQLNVLSNAITSSELATSLASPIGAIPGLQGQYSVKIDSNGHIAGFGLSNTSTTAGPTSAFIVRADKFAVIDPSSTADGLGTTTPTAGNVPFFIDSGTTYIKAAAIKDASITSAKIDELNGNKITAGTITSDRISVNKIDASKIKLDGTSITANSSGQIVIGSISAGSITSGTLDASNVTIDNLYANNITGDINRLYQFSLASAVQIGGGDTQVWSGQFPAMPTGGKPKKPYISAVGFGNWENDVVYQIKLQMRANVPATTTTIGTITAVTAAFFWYPYVDIPASVSFSGDVQSKVQSGGSLRIGSTTRGTVFYSTYDTSTDTTRIFYQAVNGGFSSSHVSSTATHVITASFTTVSTSMFRPDYDDHPEPFVISGGLPTNYSVTVDARIMFNTLETNQGNLPYWDHTTDWTNDKVFALDGLMMSLR